MLKSGKLPLAGSFWKGSELRLALGFGMTNKVVFSFPGCAPFAQHGARALHEAGLLAAYVTTFRYNHSSPLGRFLRTSLRPFYRDPERELARRQITELPPELIHSYPLPEIIRRAAEQVGPITADLVWERTEKWFDRLVARGHVNDTTAIYGYEHACLESFRQQRARGGFCIYDMPICHHATMSRWLNGELEKFPELSTAYEIHRKRLAQKRNSRKDAELALADKVIVPSNFVRDSVIQAGVPKEKIWLVPFGAPTIETSFRSTHKRRFVFLVAGHLSIRKGTHYILEAWRKMPSPDFVELWMVGNWQLPAAMRQGLPGKVRIIDTVPRDQLYRMFDEASVLVFPTLAEGLAQTPLEAMARALPVITTANSGADIFIRDGENGCLIPPADPDALVSAMEWAMHHPEVLQQMGFRASETMAHWQWSDYRAQLGRTVAHWLSDSDHRVVSATRAHSAG